MDKIMKKIVIRQNQVDAKEQLIRRTGRNLTLTVLSADPLKSLWDSSRTAKHSTARKCSRASNTNRGVLLFTLQTYWYKSGTHNGLVQYCVQEESDEVVSEIRFHTNELWTQQKPK